MANLATINTNILADSGIDDINVIVSTGSYANPAWITSLAWTKITGVPSFQLLADKGQPNGYASLDGNGKVPLTQINDALIGNVNFQGLWNAATNTPTLANPPAAGTKGYYYIVSTAGTFAGITFEVGDWIISNGSAWGKVDNTDAVSSVFGRTGNVVAANGDYTTAQVTESGNLYYTDARSRAALSFSAGSGAYNTSTGVITIPTDNNQIANSAGYITSAALSGYVPTSRTITINGTTQDLSANRTFNVGTVTSVTASSPLFSSGGTTPNITIQQASGSQSGFLSSADWTTFNNKIGGTLATGQVAFGTAANTIGGDNGLFWDNTNKRLGIGTATVSTILDINSISPIITLRDSRTTATWSAGTLLGRLDFFTSDITGIGAHSVASISVVAGGANTASPDGMLVFSTGDYNATSFERWRINNTGILQSNGAQTIQTSTGNLTLATAGGNGNIVLSPNGTGNVGVGITPSIWSSANKAIQIGLGGAISSRTAVNNVQISSNYFRSASLVNTYINTDFASLYEQSSGSHFFYIAPSGTAGNAISFTQAMTLTSGGNLLVGTTTDNGARLQVSGGNVTITNSGNVFSTIKTTTNTGVASYLCQNDINTTTEIGAWGSTRSGFGAIQPNNGYIFSGDELAIGASLALKFGVGGSNTERMRITSSGNVGIGTGSPDSQLTLNGSSNSRLNMRAGDTRYGTLYADNGVFAVASITAIPLVLGTNDTERMRITSGGKVLIGTTSNDGAMLQVAGTGGSFGDTVQFYNTSTNSAFKNTVNIGDDRLATWGLILGKSGINTPNSGYHAPNGAHIVNVQNGPIRFGTNNTERMEITSGGNVLIGTTTDVGARLYVDGAFRTGTLTAGTQTAAVDWRLGNARGGTATANALVRVQINGVLVDLIGNYV